VYTAGITYLLRMMGRAPVRGEPDHPAGQPIRTAGITPGPAGAVPEGAGHDRHGPVLAQ
jgi:hypothetical protein